MHTDSIAVYWKITPPGNPRGRQDWIDAAISTALQVTPNVRAILIRSDLHTTTGTRYGYLPHPTHITISIKDEDQIKRGTHITCHGYTVNRSYVVKDTSQNRYENPDERLDRKGRPYWPAGLEGMTIQVTDTLKARLRVRTTPNGIYSQQNFR